MTLDTPSESIAQRRADLTGRIDAARYSAGRTDEVTLVAVSKVQPDERIEAALRAGQSVFGENRVQEAEARWAARRAGWPGLELRLVGPLQSNKARQAVQLFDVIETLDRPKLARALAEAMAREGCEVSCLIQVNTGLEPQKAGVAPGNMPALLGEATALGLKIDGLMCIPPVDEPAGPHFALLAKLAQAHRLSVLSMGMSADFETAIAFGATHVRVGTGFFGARPAV
ncbi:MAG: YggS family pyridoxal phosphate-dependent enzyme [Pseudomonadota bacterium]